MTQSEFCQRFPSIPALHLHFHNSCPVATGQRGAIRFYTGLPTAQPFQFMIIQKIRGESWCFRKFTTAAEIDFDELEKLSAFNESRPNRDGVPMYYFAIGEPVIVAPVPKVDPKDERIYELEKEIRKRDRLLDEYRKIMKSDREELARLLREIRPDIYG